MPPRRAPSVASSLDPLTMTPSHPIEPSTHRRAASIHRVSHTQSPTPLPPAHWRRWDARSSERLNEHTYATYLLRSYVRPKSVFSTNTYVRNRRVAREAVPDRTYVSSYVRSYVRTYVRIRTYVYVRTYARNTYMYVRTYVCM